MREAGEIDLRKAVVDDLSHCEVTTIAGNIETLRLDARGTWCSPLEVLALEFCPWCGLGLICDGLNCGGAVDRLLNADSRDQSAAVAQMWIVESYRSLNQFILTLNVWLFFA